jgi:hypothetical protein
MSDNDYPYSIQVLREGVEGYQDDLGSGCGRKTTREVAFSDLKEREEIGGYRIADYRLNPDGQGYWYYGLEGPLVLSGELWENPMSSMIHFTPDQKSRTDIVLSFENSQQRPLIYDMQVNNFDQLKQDLEAGILDKLRSGERVRVRMELASFSAGGKMERATGEYVKLLEQ